MKLLKRLVNLVLSHRTSTPYDEMKGLFDDMFPETKGMIER